jgi:hypothetical protein
MNKYTIIGSIIFFLTTTGCAWGMDEKNTETPPSQFEKQLIECYINKQKEKFNQQEKYDEEKGAELFQQFLNNNTEQDIVSFGAWWQKQSNEYTSKYTSGALKNAVVLVTQEEKTQPINNEIPEITKDPNVRAPDPQVVDKLLGNEESNDIEELQLQYAIKLSLQDERQNNPRTPIFPSNNQQSPNNPKFASSGHSFGSHEVLIVFGICTVGYGIYKVARWYWPPDNGQKKVQEKTN